MQTGRLILTYDDYAAIPNDGRRYELFEGEIAVTPAPGSGHQRVSGRLFRLIGDHVERFHLGEVLYAPLDVILSDCTVLQPDLVYVEAGRVGQVSERGIEGPPTLVVEILSPSTTLVDRRTKFNLYARYGVPYYWIVDPGAHLVEAYVLAGEGYALAARVAGSEPVGLPPFPELGLVPSALWP